MFRVRGACTVISLMSVALCSDMNTVLSLGLPTPVLSCPAAAQKHLMTDCLELCLHFSVEYPGDMVRSFLLLVSEWREGPVEV